MKEKIDKTLLKPSKVIIYDAKNKNIKDAKIRVYEYGERELYSPMVIDKEDKIHFDRTGYWNIEAAKQSIEHFDIEL